MTRFLKLSILLFGIILSAWTLTHPELRDTEGILESNACLLLSASAALLILACGLSTSWQTATCWLSLALMGQGIALQLIQAGPTVRYQHYLPLSHLTTQAYGLQSCYLGAQTLLVFYGLRNKWALMKENLHVRMNIWKIVGIGLILILSSAPVSRDIYFYFSEIIFSTFVQAINLGNIVLMVWALPEKPLIRLKSRLRSIAFLENAWDSKKNETCLIEPVAFFAAIWVLTLAASLNIFIYGQHPHIQDEVAYLLQAKGLANGEIYMPAPPVKEAFDVYLMQYKDTSWFGVMAPAWPAFLAIGVVLGIPWIINPLLAALNVLLMYIFLRKIYDRHVARIGLLLVCFSPWNIFMAMNFMNHTFTLTCALMGLIGLVGARNTNKAIFGWLAGGATGIATLIRPLDGVIIAGILGISALGLGGKRLRLGAFFGLVMSTVLVGAINLPYNYFLTDDPFAFPTMTYMEKKFGPGSNAYGFGATQGMGWPTDPFPGHDIIDGLINTNLNISSLNSELFGWSTGSLIFVAIFLFSKSLQKSDVQMLFIIGSVFAAYFAYWFSGGPDFGPRYWFLMLIPMVALTARGSQVLLMMLTYDASRSFITNTKVLAGIGSLCFLTLINYFPWRAIDKYHHYLNMRPDISTLAKEHNFEKSLVLIRGRDFPDFASAMIFNPLDFSSLAPIYAWDKNPRVRAKLIDFYSDRPIWFIDGPTITQNGFKVINGPTTRADIVFPENPRK